MKTESDIRAMVEPIARSVEKSTKPGAPDPALEAAARDAVVELFVSTLWAFHMLVDSQLRIAALLEQEAKGEALLSDRTTGH